MMTIREPRTASSIPLGAVSIPNPTARRRRIMHSAIVPLAETDGVQNGDPMTAISTGTNQNELAQCVYDWVAPYATAQKRVRVQFPVVLDASADDTRVQIARSGAGVGGPFRLRGNVQAGIEALGIRFFCGPAATHWVTLKAPGQLPAPIRQGIRSRTYAWSARVYEPSHSPGTRTQWYAYFEVEVLDDEDYAEFWCKAVNCDPRVDEPDGMSRTTWTDTETELGFEFLIPNQNAVQPVPFAPEQCVVSLAYTTDRWRWVMDRRLVFGSQICNDTIPWGQRGDAEGVLLFKGQSGSLGDQLRDDSLQAWVDWPSPIESVSDQCQAKPGAWVVPYVRRAYKRHEHFDQNRDSTYVRNRLRTQLREMLREPANGGRAYLWDRGPSTSERYVQKHGVDTTGGDAGWSRTPLWEAMAYMVPESITAARRWVHSWGSPIEFLNADGSKVTALNESDLQIEVMAVGQRLGNGTLLGKSRLQSWRQNQNVGLLRTPIAGTPVMTGKDRAHFEWGMPFALAALSPSWRTRDLAHTLAYTTILGSWMPHTWTVGVIDQPRGLARGITMFGWASWVFGSDDAWDSRLESFRTNRIEPAEQGVQQTYQLAPRAQRQYKTVTIQTRNSFGGDPVRVDLTNWDYGRPWEDQNAALGLIAIAHHMVPLNPGLLAPWTTFRDDYVSTFLYSMPRGVDADGRVLWSVLRPTQTGQTPQPPTLYEPAAAIATVAPNTGRLTQQQWEQNNWSLCDFLQGQCAAANSGFARMGNPSAGTHSFCATMNSWVDHAYGAVGDMRSVRYCFDDSVGRFPIYSPINRDVYNWLTSQQWAAFGEHLHVPTNVTNRANIGFAPTGVAMLSNGRLAVTRGGTSNVSIVDRGSGVVQTITPQTTANWSGVVAYGTKVLLLNGYDPDLNRVTRWFWSTTEQIAGAGSVITWVLDTIDGRDFRGAAYDPLTDSYLACGYRLGRTTIWRVPITGGGAVIDTTITPHEDFDTQPQSIAISQDGKLLAMGRTDGTVWLHTRAQGGYWSHPRLRVQRGGWVTFTRHNREDDALRLVSISEAGQIVESEV